MTDDEFLHSFEDCALARAEWTHAAHIRMAWLYLTRIKSDAEVFDRVRDGIKKLNATFVGRQQMTCMRRPIKAPDPRGLDGYHETVTVAFVTIIASRIVPGEDLATFQECNPDLFDSKLSALLKYYSQEQLFSSLAKAEFVEPDLERLP